jgi:HK97 family phage major capsid protein
MGNHILKLTQPAEYMKRLAWHEKLEESIGFGPKEKVALQEDTASEGGNLVPTIVESEILRLVADNSVLRPLVRKVPMTVKTHAYPTRNAAFSAAIIAEEGTITDSVPSNPFAQSSLTAKKLACFATVAGELLQDNVVMLADYLATEFGEQIGLLEDTQALEGDGTGSNFTGVVAASGVNSVTSGANGDFLSWQKAAGSPWAARQRSSRRGAQWFVAPEVIQVLVRTRTDAAAAADAAGLPLFIPPLGGIGAAAPQTLVGFKYDEHSGLLTNRTVGTGTNRTNIYFGPPQTIIFGDLLGFSIELNPWSKFSSFQIDIRGLKRTGILVGVPSAWVKYTGIDPTGTMKA